VKTSAYCQKTGGRGKILISEGGTDLLKRAYIDTRHKDSYEITTEELCILIGRVSELQGIAERLCQKKIASFDRRVTAE
jgi:hypothetical protein